MNPFKYLFFSEDGWPVFEGEMIWVLIRDNSIYAKRAIFKDPSIYSTSKTVASSSIDNYINKIFKSEEAMIKYYRAKRPLFNRIFNIK